MQTEVDHVQSWWYATGCIQLDPTSSYGLLRPHDKIHINSLCRVGDSDHTASET